MPSLEATGEQRRKEQKCRKDLHRRWSFFFRHFRLAFSFHHFFFSGWQVDTALQRASADSDLMGFFFSSLLLRCLFPFFAFLTLFPLPPSSSSCVHGWVDAIMVGRILECP